MQFAQFVTKLDAMDVQTLQLFEYENQDEDFDVCGRYQLYSVCAGCPISRHCGSW
jgi:hypothetical protein